MFPIMALLTAGALVGSASGSGNAPAFNPTRLNPSSASVVVATRLEDIDFSVSQSLGEIRKSSGLTWEQLSAVLEVTRRTLHSWANGTVAVRGKNALRLQEVVEMVRDFGDRPPFKIRKELLASFGIDTGRPSMSLPSDPILMSDNRPFKHQVNVKRAGGMRIKRG